MVKMVVLVLVLFTNGLTLPEPPLTYKHTFKTQAACEKFIQSDKAKKLFQELNATLAPVMHKYANQHNTELKGIILKATCEKKDNNKKEPDKSNGTRA